MAHKDISEIHIDQAGVATYERRRILEREGQEPLSRLLESKQVRASSLIPEQGKLVLLPPSCCFHYAEDDREVFVIQDDPAVRTVYWHTTRDDQGTGVYERMRQRLIEQCLHHVWGETAEAFEKRLHKQVVFRLSFPYMLRFYLFVAGQHDRATMWFRPAPLTSDRDELFIPNLPNRNNEGVLCITDASRNIRTRDSAASTIMKIEKEFWLSPWTDHWTESFVRYAGRVPDLASPWEWERASAINPLFSLQVPWSSEERTVAQEVRRLLAVRVQEDHPGRVFGYFEQRIRAADPWDSQPEKAKEVAIEVSGARVLLLNNGKLTLAIGDRIRFQKGEWGVPHNQPFEIEWFSRPDKAHTRTVKLANLEEPKRIIINDQLHEAVVVVQTAVTEPILIGDNEIGPGAFCALGPTFGAERGGLIERAYRGGRGAIHVELAGARRYIIGEGDTLFEGVKILPAEKTDPVTGYSLATTIEMDGYTYTVGESIYRGSQGYERLNEFVIEAFFPLNPNGTRVCVVKGEGKIPIMRNTILPQSAMKKHESLTVRKMELKVGSAIFLGPLRTPKIILDIMETLEGNTFYLKVDVGLWISMGSQRNGWNEEVKLVPTIVVQDDRCTFGGVTYSAGEMFYDKKTGRVFKICGFIHDEVAKGLVTVQAGALKIPLIEQWQLREDFQQVFYEYQASKKVPLLKRGMRIRMLLDTAELKVGKRLVISHLIQKGERMAVVTTTGHCIPIDQGYFEVLVKDTWRKLPSVRQTKRSTAKKFFPMVYLVASLQKSQRRFGLPIGAKMEHCQDQNGVTHYIGAVVSAEPYSMTFHHLATEKMRDYFLEYAGRVVFAHDHWLYVDTGVESSWNTSYSSVYEMSRMMRVPEHLKNDKKWWSRIVLVNADYAKVNRLSW